MPAQCYTVTPHPISTILTWVSSNEIAIPEIQRPFVWDATQVRNLLDSLYQGFPVGYLIAWRNPNVRLKDGSTSAGKKILIDGQQRVTALMAAFQGREVVTKDYRRTRIRIAFHPLEDRFEVTNPAIQKDVAWIPDIAELFKPSTSFFSLVKTYCERNPNASEDVIFAKLEAVKGMMNNQVGLIELHEALDIETVTKIFIRINSFGTQLSQADFAMSKIASNERFGGQDLRKAIDYFCHLAVEPSAYPVLKEGDPVFAKTDYWHQMTWLKAEQEDLYNPNYTDMLRVAFTSEFQRGKLEDLVALLSGRNFETKQFEEEIAEDAFRRLSQGVMDFMNKTNFQRFIMILRSAGFIDETLFSGQNALNFAYILFLTLRKQNLHPDLIETLVRRWYVLSVLKGRYSSSPESSIDFDIRQIHAHGAETFIRATEAGELSEGFWTTLLPQELNTSVGSSPYFRLFKAAQVKAKDAGFLSKAISVFDLIDQRGDVHHLFPKALLKKHGKTRGDYNQIANYAMAQSEINVAIGHKAPKVYMDHVLKQCNGGPKTYGGITSLADLHANLKTHCIPDGFEIMDLEDFPSFLEARRRLMARKLQAYYETL